MFATSYPADGDITTRTSLPAIGMVAERRRSRREPLLKVYLADGSDMQCGARSACWKQLELDVAAAAECVAVGRMGHCGLGTVLGDAMRGSWEQQKVC